MISNASPVLQASLGTLFTWGMTAAGAGLVIFFHGTQRKVLDGSLGFAAGVMLAASYWSLLAPAIETAENSGLYGSQGEYAYIPVAFGFILGAFFVYMTDLLMQNLQIGASSANIALALRHEPKFAKDGYDTEANDLEEGNTLSKNGNLARRKAHHSNNEKSIELNANLATPNSHSSSSSQAKENEERWRRILLLIVAITVHNIPEGLAVGVGFGAIGKSPSATFESARNLAIGIGIQNFPEGLAVSLPLRGAGFSVWKSFWYGQLSGMVEPIAGILGAAAVSYAEPLLPYGLAFAAGAMIYVVLDDIIPESRARGNETLASWTAILGFVVMMCLDVGLG